MAISTDIGDIGYGVMIVVLGLIAFWIIVSIIAYFGGTTTA